MTRTFASRWSSGGPVSRREVSTVAFVAVLTAHATAAVETEGSFLNIDLAATINHLAGGQPGHQLDGRIMPFGYHKEQQTGFPFTLTEYWCLRRVSTTITGIELTPAFLGISEKKKESTIGQKACRTTPIEVYGSGKVNTTWHTTSGALCAPFALFSVSLLKLTLPFFRASGSFST